MKSSTWTNKIAQNLKKNTWKKHEGVFGESTDRIYLYEKKWLAPVREGSIAKSETPKQTGKAMGVGGQKQPGLYKIWDFQCAAVKC